jgi:polyhydroxyalkanoate synthesis regulator phasin
LLHVPCTRRPCAGRCAAAAGTSAPQRWEREDAGALRGGGGANLRPCAPRDRCDAGIAMIDTVKKALLAGVGAAVVTKDKIEKALEEFVRQGKVSADEARALAERIAEDGRREFEQVSESVSSKVRELMRSKEEVLQARLATIEERLAALEGKSPAAQAAEAAPAAPADGETAP